MYVQLFSALFSENRKREVKVQKLQTHRLSNQLTPVGPHVFLSFTFLLLVPLSSNMEDTVLVVLSIIKTFIHSNQASSPMMSKITIEIKPNLQPLQYYYTTTNNFTSQ